MSRICLTTIGLLLIPRCILAQSATVQDAQSESQRALQDFQPQGQSFNQSGGINLNELIHRANLANKRSLQEFQEEQNQSFNEAVEAFRKQQKLQQKPKP
ncbi:MAG: hypothetical protein LDL47_00025 [Cyanobacteria bacterium KgW148]|nr:hypothetical protein [Cyanobacteria bacterium KgW148]